jgi:hypothetical protein
MGSEQTERDIIRLEQEVEDKTDRGFGAKPLLLTAGAIGVGATMFALGKGLWATGRGSGGASNFLSHRVYAQVSSSVHHFLTLSGNNSCLGRGSRDGWKRLERRRT